MKLSSRIAILKKRQHTKLASPGSCQPKGGRFGLPRWAWLALGLVVAGGGTLAVLEFLVWNHVPPALVGKWQVEQGSEFGGTFDFSRDGTLDVHLTSQGRSIHLKSRVAVRGKTLRTTPQSVSGRQEETREWTILELTADSLILEMENGQTLKMVRVT